jgi:hypothetical protein
MASEALWGLQQSRRDQAFRSDAVQDPIIGKVILDKSAPDPFSTTRPCAFVNKPSTGDKAEMLAVSKGVTPNLTAPGARANVAPTPTTPEESGESDQVYIRQAPASVSGESGAQETRANKRTPRIVGVRKALGISIRPILPFHRSTRP